MSDTVVNNALPGATAGHTPEVLIRLSGITKTYGRGQAAFRALKGIDLEIHNGDFVAIMGASGSM